MLFSLLILACGEPPEPVPDPVEAPAPAPDAAEIPMAPAEPGLLTEAQFAALHALTEDDALPPRGEVVEIDGMRAYLSLPEGATGPVPAVVVVHEWWGLNDHIRYWADRLATQGYATLAVDLYDGRVATTASEAMDAMKQVDSDAALAKLTAAHAFLRSDERIRAPRTAAVGWCFGGGWSLQLAMAEPELDAAVIYYGRLVEDEAALAKIEAPLMGIFGSQDAGIPEEAVRAFEARLGKLDKPIEIHMYEAGHAFANPSGGHYDGAKAEDAWGKVSGFLAAALKGS